MKSMQDKLVSFLEENGKHASYQSLPKFVKNIIGDDIYHAGSKADECRFDYIKSKINFHDKKILDIGCNLGYFTLSAVDSGARHVVAYEGFSPHANFLSNVSSILALKDRISVHNEYYLFNVDECSYDVVFLLNVLHHIGDDYGDKSLLIESVKENISNQLNSLSVNTNTLVLQLGFNWKGNSNYGLFSNGTKREMIDYVKTAIYGVWNLRAIGIAEKTIHGEIIYNELNDANVNRQDELGEFLNRPIFILDKNI
ncbi:class I SAM-dependent methyltransferase [Pectobacterium brasiliense]|uniref:class I SAM-dependent methyltransferase n=1 Tax=Pectobacterium brasiliense TaxID=180957 RepID=UPI0015DF639A|nr:class I SAM-dependent methyltransferase [Pectobacterium brasiliense]MBA0216996.1 class I SAM-dependent methyltransferase [Pectobacterium brasiliense]